MTRREFIVQVGAMATLSPLTVHAQTAAMPVLGWLVPVPRARSREFLDAFRNGLGEAGFVEGKNVRIERPPSEVTVAQLPALADYLVRRGVSVIMAASPPAALAVKRATQNIPMVFLSGADPVKIGLVSSFNRPGGNATGFHVQFSQVVGKRLSLLHEMVPQATRIAVLVNPDNRSDTETSVRNATETGHALGLDIRVFNARTINGIDAAFAALVRWRADALLVAPDPFLNGIDNRIVAVAAFHALPTSVMVRSFAEVGGLMSYGPDFQDIFRRAGRYVGRILNGEKPADLPIQQPTRFELVINLKTARALGVTVPPSILLRADEMIE